MGKDFAFPQYFISKVLQPAARPTAAASPFVLSQNLLGDLATLFDREGQLFGEGSSERARLLKISRELDRMWRVKAASVRGARGERR